MNPIYKNLMRFDSDTTAPSLTFICYCLARHPEHAEKLYAELSGVDPLDLNAVSALPHLNGFINEVMRLYSVAPTVVTRQTPPQGIMMGDTFIPGDTKVLAPRWVIFRRKFKPVLPCTESDANMDCCPHV